MLRLRSCPKCQGALNLASDMYGRYVHCLQCGFTRDLPQSLPQPAPEATTIPGYREVERKAA